ncbi:uncharacterized protein LOC134444635 [Engraulis encrasicolus]|uniref:uncharacterized protein LOC134444635 n=1 Tax=Engraulis encrasicolus TaxID=184585 RepID=UPI002FCE6C20
MYVLKHKDEVFNKFVQWKAEVETYSGRKLKVLRTDNGGEYTSKEFDAFLKTEGVRHELTVPKTPEQNGVAERMNRTLVETVRSMLADAKLPQKFWAEALATAVYLRNRSPTKAVADMTPYEAWTVSHLRVFGCDAYAHIPKDERKKLDPKARKCILLGYGTETKGYRLYDTKQTKVFYSRDVVFNESVCGVETSEDNHEHSLMEFDCVNSEEPVVTETAEPEAETQRPVRARQPPDRYGEWATVAESDLCEPETMHPGECSAMDRPKNMEDVSPKRVNVNTETKKRKLDSDNVPLERCSFSEHSRVSERTSCTMDSGNFTEESDLSTSDFFRLLTEDQLRCPICKEVLRDPVGIPCGHSFCRQCINSDWQQPNQEDVFACPQCQATYSTKPLYYISGVVAEVVKRAKFSPELPHSSYARQGDVVCDFCTGRKLRAVKSCLTCTASYCGIHIKEHYYPAMEHHIMVEPTEYQRKHFCLKHRAVNDVFCQTDKVSICSDCALLEHNGHDLKIVDAKQLLQSPQVPEAGVSLPTGAVVSPAAGSTFPQMSAALAGTSPGSSQCSSADWIPRAPRKRGKAGFHCKLQNIQSDRLAGQEGTSSERLKIGISCSPTPSQDSLKTHRSMDLPDETCTGLFAYP